MDDDAVMATATDRETKTRDKTRGILSSKRAIYRYYYLQKVPKIVVGSPHPTSMALIQNEILGSARIRALILFTFRAHSRAHSRSHLQPSAFSGERKALEEAHHSKFKIEARHPSRSLDSFLFCRQFWGATDAAVVPLFTSFLFGLDDSESEAVGAGCLGLQPKQVVPPPPPPPPPSPSARRRRVREKEIGVNGGCHCQEGRDGGTSRANERRCSFYICYAPRPPSSYKRGMAHIPSAVRSPASPKFNRNIVSC